MKIDFEIPNDNKYHQFCPKCHSENIHRIFKDEKTYYECSDCCGIFPRLIVIDPQVTWWIDNVTKEYWHESVGIFIFNKNNEALFFERIIFPFAFTVPAGHLDTGEKPEEAIVREVFEETGLVIKNIKLLLDGDVVGDECRRGADNHKWHLFISSVDDISKLKINDEGVEPIWLSLDEALLKNLTFPVRYFINNYRDKIKESLI